MGLYGTVRSLDRLTAAGVPEDRARTFVRVVAEAREERFDAARARRDLLAAGYPPAQVDALMDALDDLRRQVRLGA